MVRLKELALKEEKFANGHRMCAGCAAPIAVRHVMMGTDCPVVVACATGCLEVCTTIFPYTSWKVPFIHSAFENAAATISGVEACYQAMKRTGRIDKEVKFVAFGGDGGTYDIGLQSLSGAAERGHDFLYVCYNNEAYMNTGVQRSSATPVSAHTSTAPIGRVKLGKMQNPKDLTGIMAAHNMPYVAQASMSNWRDLVGKATKAFATPGPAFINIISPCPVGWRYPPEKTIETAQAAVDSCFWPLYEVEHGEWKLTYDPKKKKHPVKDWFAMQGRFRHLMREENQEVVERVQTWVDGEWAKLRAKCGLEPEEAAA